MGDRFWRVLDEVFGASRGVRGARDAFAVAVAAAVLGLGALAFMQPMVDPGMLVAPRDSGYVVDSVRPGSPAWLSGIEPGMQIGTTDTGPQWVDVVGNATVTVTGPGDGPAGVPLDSSSYGVWLGWPDWARQQGGAAVALGVGLLLGGWFVLRRGRGGPLAPFAFSLPVAVAGPLLMVPLARLATMPGLAATAILLPLTQVPFAIDLLAELPPGRARRALGVLLAATLAAAAMYLFWLPVQYWSRAVGIGLVAAIAFVPAIAVARERRAARAVAGGEAPSGRFVGAGEVLVAGITPAVVLLPFVPKDEVILWPIVVWLGAVFLARFVTLDPLQRLANRATLQRDVVVAATEAERGRIAADIHDEVLQDMTMLVRRLDAGGDPANAEAAREIAARLRAICGELRLPILDDLGVGPALDWLVGRNEELGGGSIYLERLEDEPRMPAPVELALFRIAQEAVTNAIRHGKPPIVVRFRSGGTWAELDVDDAGPGLAAGAAEHAEQSGHYGLLNMAQRAEQIGADFRLGRRPGAGTRVSVAWEAAITDDAVALQPSPEAAR